MKQSSDEQFEWLNGRLFAIEILTGQMLACQLMHCNPEQRETMRHELPIGLENNLALLSNLAQQVAMASMQQIVDGAIATAEAMEKANLDQGIDPPWKV